MLALRPHLQPSSTLTRLTLPNLLVRRIPHRLASSRDRNPSSGLATPTSTTSAPTPPPPYHLASAYAAWPKRPSRPFPPPFFSKPAHSFSDPLSTHQPTSNIDGAPMRGATNGDDALLAGERWVGCNDGVGAWAQRERGCAALWSRLVLHYWAGVAEGGSGEGGTPAVVEWLDKAYALTKEALSGATEWLGTTTVCVGFLQAGGGEEGAPVLFVVQLGDCKMLVVRAGKGAEGEDLGEVVFKTEEQWHYFDCPRQLGTNSPDEPLVHAVLSKVELREGDIVLAMSDGVTDNLWENEIADAAVASLKEWRGENEEAGELKDGASYAEGMKFVARELVLTARKVAEDPFAASPFMERAVEEGLAIEGGKLDDISVVAALCMKRKG